MGAQTPGLFIVRLTVSTDRKSGKPLSNSSPNDVHIKYEAFRERLECRRRTLLLRLEYHYRWFQFVKGRKDHRHDKRKSAVR